MRWYLGLFLFIGVTNCDDDAAEDTTSCSSSTTVGTPYYSVYDSTVTSVDTVFETTTVDVTHFLDVTLNRTEIRTQTVIVNCTEYSTTTIEETVDVTNTETVDVTNTKTVDVTNTETKRVTKFTTIVLTHTSTTTVPATITSLATTTIFSTFDDPCPSSCSLSVGTVDLFFWPSNRSNSYPSTYFDQSLDYTFTYPSVYLLIPTAHGTNSEGFTGPSTSDWILKLDLDEVSTIQDGTITQQLNLADLGTDCPRTADPSAIATLVDPRCDPIIAAPKQVSSWAYPCNACGRLGLFDPPYAVPTITGGLLPDPTTSAEIRTTHPPSTETAPPQGIVMVVYYRDGIAVSTSSYATTGIIGTITSSVIMAPTSTSVESSALPTTTKIPNSMVVPTTELTTSASSSSTTTTTAVAVMPTSTPSTLPTASVAGSALRQPVRFTAALAGILSALYFLLQ